MPLGWECRAHLLKQVPAKPAERRGPPPEPTPGPQKYELPHIFCAKGYNYIKRAPAYTFGLRTPCDVSKPAATNNAQSYNIRKFTRQGLTKIPGGVVSDKPVSPRVHWHMPGPATYKPPGDSRFKRSVAYTCQPPAVPPYQSPDMWTCPPNMYLPNVAFKKAPAYTLGNVARNLSTPSLPGPGEHYPNFNYTKRNKPAFTFGYPFRPQVVPDFPSPDHYCHKKFLLQKRTSPAPSFGIHHSPYLGKFPAYEKPTKLDVEPAGT